MGPRVKINSIWHKVFIGNDDLEYFCGNRIIHLLLDTSKLDLNDLWAMHRSDLFTLDEMRELYRLIQFSVGRYAEVFEQDKIESNTID